MSQIRRQSIISSVVVYIGFALGLFNTYLFTRQGGFTTEEYGLTNMFMAIATLMLCFSSMGMSSYVYKFYPYYKDNLPDDKNDLFSWALVGSIIGFILVIIGGIVFKDLVIRKYAEHAPLLLRYYNWIFPFGLGLNLFSILEAYAWQVKKSVLSNFLREVQFRIFTTILILLATTGVITSFDKFIKLYSFTFLAIAAILLFNLLYTRQLHFNFSISRVTKKFWKKILTLIAFIYGGSLVFTISSVFDSLVIAAVLDNGLAKAGIYALALNIASLIQAPQRAVVSSSIPVLSRAWKEKHLAQINRIYHRSSLNMLLFGICMFLLLWLNFSDGVFTFKLKHEYLDAKWVFFFIGLSRIIDMGTGVNGQIISTSTFWRFDFLTGLILVIITLPFNYFLTKKMGITGPAIANLCSFFIYNFIRYLYLYRKFRMQPFTANTLYTILLGLGVYYITWLLFNKQQGFTWLIIRSSFFLIVYMGGAFLFRLSPDLLPVLHVIQKRLGIKKGA